MLPNAKIKKLGSNEPNLNHVDKNDIDIVTVSINYSDYLYFYLKENTKFFDKNKITIVTDPSDLKTIKLCESYKVNVFYTDKIQYKNKLFNRAYILNRALRMCNFKNWVLHLDSDVVLPPESAKIKNLNLDIECIYGTKRCVLKTLQDYENRKPSPGYAIGRRKFVVTGFFQLFNVNSKIYKSGWRYNEDLGCGKEDSLFSSKFQQYRLPFDVYHVGDYGLNWDGRVTEKFV